MPKKTSQTESIEVPIEIANEVKLFINLLVSGEISSLGELFAKAERKKTDLFDLMRSDDLWNEVLDCICPPITQALFRQQGQLLNINISSAVVGLRSKSLVQTNLKKIPHLEKAFDTVLGHKVKVELVALSDIPQSSQQQSGISRCDPADETSAKERAPKGDPSISSAQAMVQSPPKKGLTEDQDAALNELKSFTQGQEKFFRLTGYAGTGKSFLICRYLEWLQSEEISFVAVCPTNKATKSLKKLAESENLSIDVKTVAQLLGQQPELNEQTGKEEFVCNGEADLSGYSVVVIDEFSMVNRDNFSEIVNAASSSLLTKIVFVGDAAQLPPVNEKEPIVAKSSLIERDATLTSVVRYDGHLARVAEAIRSDSKYTRVIYPFSSTSDRTILCVPQSEWRDRAISLFESKEYSTNPDYVRFLAWRNKTVHSLNLFVRSKLWGEDAPPYVPGDILIARKPLFRPKAGGKGKNKWRILINNSEECRVTEAGRLSELLFQNQIYQYWQVLVQPETGKPQTLSILTTDSQKLHTQQVKYFASKKQWNYYFDLSRMFDDVGYAYALTTHKAQGSTIDYVFLDVDDMKRCSDRQKLLYTALTRAKKQALISH